jgi:hypothetical protein
MGAQEPLEKDVEAGESKPMMDEGNNDKASAKRKHKTRGGQIIDIACIGLNILSTVTLVFLNKWFVQTDQSPFRSYIRCASKAYAPAGSLKIPS